MLRGISRQRSEAHPLNPSRIQAMEFAMKDPALSQFSHGFRDTGLFLLAMLSTVVGVFLITRFVMIENPAHSYRLAESLSCLFLFVWKEQLLTAPAGRRIWGIAMLGFVSGTVTTLMNALFAA
jgi:hypothetical protein